MKSPCHTGVLDTLLQVFPDAVVVHCHRDAEVILPSMCGLTEEMRRVHSNHIDRAVIGPEMLDYFGTNMDRYLAIRDALPADRILDVHYQEIVDDVASVIRRIYARAGREVDAETLTNARQFEEQRPQHYLGSYRYAAPDYGLTPAMINARFADYRRRFAGFQ